MSQKKVNIGLKKVKRKECIDILRVIWHYWQENWFTLPSLKWIVLSGNFFIMVSLSKQFEFDKWVNQWNRP